MEKYDITGMSCAACQARVEKAVSKLPGVDSCAVNLLTNSMAVEGSATADEIIRAVAKELAGTFANGMTFRYGGDEFLIIIPIEGGDVSDIREQVQHWEKSVTDLSMSGVDEKIVCSHGLVHGTPDNASDLRTLIDGADAQLYLAKRNRSGD